MKIKKELTLEAVMDNLNRVLAFVDKELENNECPMLTQTTLDMAVEELFTNIASYSYNPTIGDVKVRIEVSGDPIAVSITFMDQGVPYDPLAKEDPDVDKPIEERPIGGLGIFMVKNSMDEVNYEYRDGQNILTIRKNLTDKQ